MVHGLIFLLDLSALILFIMVFIKQVKLQHEYKNLNGLKYHRLAYMCITFSMIMVVLFTMFQRICLIEIEGHFNYYAIEYLPIYAKIVLIVFKSFMVAVASFSYLWFSGSKFKFLKLLDRFIN